MTAAPPRRSPGRFASPARPAQPVLETLRWVRHWPTRRRHPELADLWHESSRLDALMADLLTPTSNCIDVGCHVGSMLALMVGAAPHGTHHAVEASPAKAALLSRRWPDVDVRAVAVSDEPGTVTFYETIDEPGFSSLRRPVADDPDNPGSRSAIRPYDVPCETLDRLFFTSGDSGTATTTPHRGSI